MKDYKERDYTDADKYMRSLKNGHGYVFYKAKTAKCFFSAVRLSDVWENKELFAICVMMAKYMERNTGILKVGEAPYTWAAFAKEVGISATTIYRWRDKVIRAGYAREIQLYGRKYIALNPMVFGVGEKVPSYIMSEFNKIQRR